MVESTWTTQEIEAWTRRERLGGNEWAEKERILSKEESPSPGPWRSLSWQREILDTLADNGIDWVVGLKAAQVGWSELVRCAIGRWALLDPGDTLWVMADEIAATKAMKKLRLMFSSCPTLRPLVSTSRTEKTLLALVLTNGMRIVIGWAGSAQSLASDPFRYVILDEVGKYRTSVQGEASPVELAKERTKTYGRRAKVVLLSSPKNDDDLISQAHRSVLDRRVFSVPCPSCKVVQPLEWSAVRIPGGMNPDSMPTDQRARARLAEEVEREQGAWLECRSCKGKIDPRKGMNAPEARWTQEEDVGTGSRRRAYHTTELVHWETTLSDLVAKFLRCSTPKELQGFYNGSLGTGYKSEASMIHGATFAARAHHPARLVPSWATVLVATIDTQAEGWWYLIRAWGPGDRSRGVAWGFVETLEQVKAEVLDAKFQVEGSPDVEATVTLAAIDTGGGIQTKDGSLTKQVYSFVRQNRKLYAIKGEGDDQKPKESNEADAGTFRKREVMFSTDYGEKSVDLYLLNRSYYADELASLVKADEPVLWEESKGFEHSTYTSQMSSMHKVIETSERGTKALWKKKSGHSQNHLWDCSRYQVWCAEFVRAGERKIPKWDPRLQRAAPKAGAGREPREKKPGFLDDGDRGSVWG